MNMQKTNVGDLNKYKMPSEGGGEYAKDNSVNSGNINAYFRNLETRLVEHIKEADFVYGAVAWLTSSSILTALSQVKRGVQIVVQKEDFLRPDTDQKTPWAKNWLREKYDMLKCDIMRHNFGGVIGSLSYAIDPSMSPVMCVGNHNRDKAPAFPRMHNKFLIFAKEPTYKTSSYDDQLINPYAVWTGSFNFTKNAGHSLENALYITKKKIVRAYSKEYEQIFALSEFLDWQSDWCEPAYRIGS